MSQRQALTVVSASVVLALSALSPAVASEPYGQDWGLASQPMEEHLPLCDDVPDNTPCVAGPATRELRDGDRPKDFCDLDHGLAPNGQPAVPVECSGEPVVAGVGCNVAPLPWECTAAPGKSRPGEEGAGIPPFGITPSSAGEATLFHFEEGLAAIGFLAFTNIVYMEYGDGAVFGDANDLRRPISLPRSHSYREPGTYTMRLHVYVVEDGVEKYFSSAITFTVDASSSPQTPSTDTDISGNAPRLSAVALSNDDLYEELKGSFSPSSPASDHSDTTQADPAGIFDTLGGATSALVSGLGIFFGELLTTDTP